jgi:hypothetical protein
MISVSIANYAISASYLGRETRLTRRRMEKRKQRLNGVIKDLQAKGLPIGELKKETKEAEEDLDALGNRLFFLSWLGAVILPSIFFIASLVSAVIVMNSDILLPNTLVDGLMSSSIGSLGLGFLFLMVVIGVIDSSARKTPAPEFKVYFDNYAESISLKRNAKESIRVNITNEGEDIAENVEVYATFPKTFDVDRTPHYSLYRTSPQGPNPESICVTHELGLLHIGTTHYFTIFLTAPNEKKKYDITFQINERKSEPSKHDLSIEVVD